MDDGFMPPSILTYRKTCRVRGPRPCSWTSSSSDSFSNENRDTWPWPIQRSRGSTLRSTTSTASSDSSVSSSSSSPVQTLDILAEYDNELYCSHARRRKPAGPRPPRNIPRFDMRPGLLTNTPLPAIPQLSRERSPTTLVQSIIIPQSSHIPSLTIHSQTNFPLDWDAIFEILGCSEAFSDSTAG